MPDILDKLKLEFAELKKSVQDVLKGKKMSFAQVTTSDGKILSYDGELGEGTMVMMDGGPAPDGAYTLEDGTTCNVAGGKITSITKPSGQYDEKFAALEKSFKDFVAKYEEENTSRNDQFEKIGKVLEGITGQLGKQLEEIQKFASQAAAPAEPAVSRRILKMNSDADKNKNINSILEEIKKLKTA